MSTTLTHRFDDLLTLLMNCAAAGGRIQDHCLNNVHRRSGAAVRRHGEKRKHFCLEV
jgi:hypothetical protein